MERREFLKAGAAAVLSMSKISKHVDAASSRPMWSS